MYNEEKIIQCKIITCGAYSELSRDLVSTRVFRIELIICLTIKVERVKVHIHVVRDVLRKRRVILLTYLLTYYLFTYSMEQSPS